MWTHNAEVSGVDTPVIDHSTERPGEDWHETTEAEYEAYTAYWTTRFECGHERGECTHL